ncbi:MAG: KH domain-containing protein [Synechococcales cyanobacterium C42_A2020_086]|nr:KH domain-containing protein [Synechococcales cyanobacterium M58_A2018_015]MBF2074424.1 KH domain-containing protein [Synechococcales cyanobacterium C42_A2020_086]
MPDSNVTLSSQPATSSPDYKGLVNFLVQPFLDSPESLRVDCELLRTSRVLIRVAFEGEDKGRVFGRGGRNIQAVRTVIQAVAQAAGHSAYLEVFGGPSLGAPSGREGVSDERSSRSPSQRSPKTRSRH